MDPHTAGTNTLIRRLGAGIFALGLLLLALVFTLAAIAFAQVPARLASPPGGVAALLAVALVRTLFLLVMAYAASLLASKGLELYQAGREEGPR